VRERQAEVLRRVLPRVRDVRRGGSAALDLAWTALGRCDAYWERGVKAWDVAAGALLCARAGLELHELAAGDGMPAGLLAAPPALAAELLALVTGG
jgi:myo-inositol-1(or 4)-monophosphatase